MTGLLYYSYSRNLSGESFTGYQLTKGQSQDHNEHGRIGKNYKH